MEETSRIYPSLSQLKTSEMDIEKINIEKLKDRVRYMKNKETQLLLRLEHYDKLRKRWSKVKNVTQGIGIFLTISLDALTIAISSGVLVIPVVATALTGRVFLQLRLLQC